MTDQKMDSNSSWGLDEFVEKLNREVPLPQGDDGRRAATWSSRLVRHYASKKALSAPSKDGRVALYGPKHLEEAKRLTAVQTAGGSSKTAALLNSYQSDSTSAAPMAATATMTDGFPSPTFAYSHSLEDACVSESPEKMEGQILSNAGMGVRALESDAISSFFSPTALSGASMLLGSAEANASTAIESHAFSAQAFLSPHPQKAQALSLLDSLSPSPGGVVSKKMQEKQGALEIEKYSTAAKAPLLNRALDALRTPSSEWAWKRIAVQEGIELNVREDQWGEIEKIKNLLLSLSPSSTSK